MRQVVIGALFLFTLVAFCYAQPQEETLLIGPGDMLHILVFDTPELEQRVRVTDAGEITLLVGGNVKVANLTPTNAALAIENALKDGKLMVRPHVAIVVEEYATQKVSVLGEIKAPGAYVINTSRSVLDVLTMAGGLTDVADRNVLIERRSTREKVPYFVSNNANVAVDTAIKVNPGDTLIVPKVGIVYVLGDVKQPGGYTMSNNSGQLTVLELVARAGGTSHSAVPSHASLIHRTADGFKKVPLPLSAMQKGKTPDIVLRPDDVIYVPFSYLRNIGLTASGMLSSIGSATIYKF